MKNRINFLGGSLLLTMELFEKAKILTNFYKQKSIQKMLRILIEEKYNEIKNSDDTKTVN